MLRSLKRLKSFGLYQNQPYAKFSNWGQFGSQNKDYFYYRGQSFTKEEDALRHLVHPQIPRLLGAFKEEDYHYIIQEYVEGHDLQSEVLNTGDPKTYFRNYFKIEFID